MSEAVYLESLGISKCPDDANQVGRASSCIGCPGQAYCSKLSGNKSEEQEQLETRMSAIKHKIIVMSGKGGVGKSSFASLLSLGLAEKGHKVAILDVDICGPSIPKLLNCENSEVINKPWGWMPVTTTNGILVMSIAFLLSGNTTPVMWRGPRKTQIIKQFLKDTFWGRLDYLIIDTPPGTSDEHLSVIAALKDANPDGCVLITTPQELAASVVTRQVDFCKKVKLPVLGVVENMSGFKCPCCNEVYDIFKNANAGSNLATLCNLPFLGSIPIDPKICNMCEVGKSIFAEMKDDSTTLTILSIIDNICKALVH